MYKAFDKEKKIYVAIKIIKNLDEYTKRSKLEIEIITQLNKYDSVNGIVKLNDNFTYKSHQCLVFEYLEKSLRSVITNNKQGIKLF